MDVNPKQSVRRPLYILQSFLLFFPNLFLLSRLCLECAGLPGDGGWYEVKCDVAMASVTQGDCKQGAALEIVGSGWVGVWCILLILVYTSASRRRGGEGR